MGRRDFLLLLAIVSAICVIKVSLPAATRAFINDCTSQPFFSDKTSFKE